MEDTSFHYVEELNGDYEADGVEMAPSEASFAVEDGDLEDPSASTPLHTRPPRNTAAAAAAATSSGQAAWGPSTAGLLLDPDEDGGGGSSVSGTPWMGTSGGTGRVFREQSVMREEEHEHEHEHEQEEVVEEEQESVQRRRILQVRAETQQRAAEVQGDLVQKLMEKVQLQARDMQEQVQECEELKEYAHLCEERILQLDPNHRLPVSENDLRRGFAGSSSSGFSTVQPRAVSAGPSKAPTTSEYGRLLKEKIDLEVRLKKLRHDFEALDKRYSSQARSLKDTRADLDKKEKECQLLEKRLEVMSSKVEEMTEVTKETEEYASQMERKILSGGAGATYNLRRKVATSQRTLQEQQEEIVDLEDQLAESQREMDQLRSQVEILRRAASTRAQDLGLGSNKGSLLIDIAELRGTLESKKNEVQSKNDTIQSLMEQLETTEQELEVANSLVEEREGMLKSFEERLSNKDRDYFTAADRVQELEKKNQVMLKYIEDVDQKLAALRSEHLALQNQYEEAESSLSSVRESDRRNAEKLRSACSRVEEQESKLQIVDKERKALEMELRRTKNELADTEQQLSEMDAVQTQLLDAVDKATKESAQIQAELEGYKKLQGRMEEDHFALEEGEKHKNWLLSQLQEEQNRARESAQRVTDLEAKLHHAQETLAAAEKDYNLERGLWDRDRKAYEERLQQLDRKLHEARSQENSLREEVDKQRVEFSELEADHSRVSMKKEDMEQDLDATRARLSQYQEQVRELRDERKNFEERVRNLEEQLEEKSDELYHAKQQLADLQNEKAMQIKFLHEEIHGIRLERDDLQMQLRDAEDQLEQLKQQQEDIPLIEELEQSLSNISMEKESQDEKLHSMKDRLRDRERRILELENRNKQVKENLQRLRSSYNQSADERLQEILQLTNELELAQQRTSEVEDSYRQELGSCRTQLHAITNQRNALQEQVKSLTQEARAAHKRLAQLSEQFEESLQEEETNRSHSELQSQSLSALVDLLQEEISQKNDSIRELAEQKENLQDQMQSQRDEHRKRELRLRNEMDVLKEELETLSVAQGKLATCEKQLTASREEVDRLRETVLTLQHELKTKVNTLSDMSEAVEGATELRQANEKLEREVYVLNIKVEELEKEYHKVMETCAEKNRQLKELLEGNHAGSHADFVTVHRHGPMLLEAENFDREYQMLRAQYHRHREDSNTTESPTSSVRSTDAFQSRMDDLLSLQRSLGGRSQEERSVVQSSPGERSVASSGHARRTLDTSRSRDSSLMDASVSSSSAYITSRSPIVKPHRPSTSEDPINTSSSQPPNLSGYPDLNQPTMSMALSSDEEDDLVEDSSFSRYQSQNRADDQPSVSLADTSVNRSGSSATSSAQSKAERLAQIESTFAKLRGSLESR